ncbi:MAG: transglutaminase-like domain-containing protein [Halobacteriales archaeon]|nr:transglutaminase-like domain-containing protein [Halobacteriales archaeon]
MAGGAERSFADIVQDDEDLDLARAALAVARDEYPSLDAQGCLDELDALARAARARMEPGMALREQVVALNTYLFQECGFRGNLEEYYDPQNSHLNKVLERRVGIPITLSLLYIEVAQRIGLPVVGVGLPGHFVVKVAGADEEILVDPFYKGQLLDRAECQKRLDAIYGGKVVLTEQFLRAVSKRELLSRLLYNLKRIHMRSGDHPRALAVLDKLLALHPHAFEDIRDRGLVRYKAGQYGGAMEDLRLYIDFLPTAEDVPKLKHTILLCARLSAVRP